jgi:hypothetical protein
MPRDPFVTITVIQGYDHHRDQSNERDQSVGHLQTTRGLACRKDIRATPEIAGMKNNCRNFNSHFEKSPRSAALASGLAWL